MKITDDAGKELPWDGKTFGRLKVSGPAVSKAYFRVDANILDEDGYFDTGDVATIDQHGYMRITDRSKDVIKSGGEWISSIDLENLAVGHPAVAEAAVIGVHHPKWDERPLLIVQLKQGQTATREDILKYMDGKIAKWWMPDDVAFVDGIPHTATGKILKTALRDQFKAYRFPERRGVGDLRFSPCGKVAWTKSAPDEGCGARVGQPSPVRDASQRGHPFPHGERGRSARDRPPPIRP